MHLTNWSAKRAGATMTVNGTGPDGLAAKITNVGVIRPSADGSALIEAVDRNGDTHTLGPKG
jgi:hypothetical protein